jgi:predicted GNAT family acetyltransferase
VSEVRDDGVRDNKDRFRYELVVDGEVVAFVQYNMRGGRILLVHTEVPDAYSGHGYATTLVAGALDDIRRRGLEIVPVCPFVERYIERHPEYDDMVDHEMFDALNAEKK